MNKFIAIIIFPIFYFALFYFIETFFSLFSGVSIGPFGKYHFPLPLLICEGYPSICTFQTSYFLINLVTFSVEYYFYWKYIKKNKFQIVQAIITSVGLVLISSFIYLFSRIIRR